MNTSSKTQSAIEFKNKVSIDSDEMERFRCIAEMYVENTDAFLGVIGEKIEEKYNMTKEY